MRVGMTSPVPATLCVPVIRRRACGNELTEDWGRLGCIWGDATNLIVLRYSPSLAHDSCGDQLALFDPFLIATYY